MMYQCEKEQQKLRYYIDVVSFAALDSAIFLDSHPDCPEAFKYFTYYTDARKKALKEYANRFSPLTLDTVPDGESFRKWAMTPWPWEMEV